MERVFMIETDKEALYRMCIKILLLERENIKTMQFRDKEMRDKIRRIIEEEANNAVKND